MKKNPIVIHCMADATKENLIFILFFDEFQFNSTILIHSIALCFCFLDRYLFFSDSNSMLCGCYLMISRKKHFKILFLLLVVVIVIIIIFIILQ